MIASDDIVLAPLREADLPEMFDWINDRELVLLSAPYHPVHEGAHQRWFEEICKDASKVVFAIRTKPDDKLIGACQLVAIHPLHRHAQLQIRIGDPSHRGRGRGTEAVRLLLRHAFRDLNLERVYLHVFTNNAPAIRAYEKAGFRREGTLRSAVFVDGRFQDMLVMSVLRAEAQEDT